MFKYQRKYVNKVRLLKYFVAIDAAIIKDVQIIYIISVLIKNIDIYSHSGS